MERIRRLETWARLGYAARGIVYLVLGWIALSTGKALSSSGAIKAIEDFPAGGPLLFLLTFGLFGYGLYKVYSAALDLDHFGHGFKGAAKRVGRAAGGLFYFFLAYLALDHLFGGGDATPDAGRASGSGGAQQEVVAGVASSGGGDTLLIGAGLAILLIAATQLVIAFKATFMDDMPHAPRLVKPAGQLGYAARATIIAIVGYFALRAGMAGERVRNFADALAVVREDHHLLFLLIAGGLMLFGIVSLMMARYGRLADDDVVARVKANVPHPHD